MAKFQTNLTPREVLEQKYKSARSNLLLTIILTVVNVILLLSGSETMMLFSISVPYYAVIFGYFSGDQAMLITGCAIAAVMLAAYLLCWIFSKKRSGWLVAALVLFVLDSLVMALMYYLIGEFSGILDVVIRVFVLYYLIVGIRSAGQLKKMPPEAKEEAQSSSAEPMNTVQFSTPLRRAEECKHRVLLTGNYAGHRIVYRRVKRVNELVIDGYVYDEYEALMEMAHCLTAQIDGHTIEMGYDGVSGSYFRVDGQVMAKKMRLY